MTTIKLRRGTAAQWTTVNPVLAQGEPGFETDTGKHKIGNGITNWAGLKYYVDEVALSTAVSTEASARDAAINTAVSNLINGAPTALDTLLELSAQLAGDESAVGALVSSLSSHVADHNNPHVVTKAQVGLSDVPNIDTTAAIATAISAVEFIDLDTDGVPFIETGVPPTVNLDTSVASYIGTSGSPSQIDIKLNNAYVTTINPLNAAYGAMGDDTTDDRVSLQAAITAAASFGIAVDLRGKTYRVTDVVNVPAGSNVRNGTIHCTGTGKKILNVTGSNVTLSDLIIQGRHSVSTYSGSEYGIYAEGTSAAAPLTNLVIQRCTVKFVGMYAMWLKWVTGFRVHQNNVHDIGYAGIMGMSAIDGVIHANAVTDITPGTSSNMYGIQMSRDETDSLVTDPRSSNVVMSSNVVRNVRWEALGTHGGEKLSFVNNLVYGCLIGVALGEADNASNVSTWAPQQCLVSNNIIDSGVSDGSVRYAVNVTGSANATIGISNEWATGIAVVGNTIKGHGQPEHPQGTAILVRNTRGVVVSLNTIIEPGYSGIEFYHTNQNYSCVGNTVVDAWSNTQGEAFGVIASRAGYNTGHIANNSVMAGTKSATYLNSYCVALISSTSTSVSVGVNTGGTTNVYRGTTGYVSSNLGPGGVSTAGSGSFAGLTATGVTSLASLTVSGATALNSSTVISPSSGGLGGLLVTSTNPTVGGYQIIARGAPTGYGAGIRFESTESGAGTVLPQALISADGESPWNSVANADSYLRFWTATDGVLSEHWRIKSAGDFVPIAGRSIKFPVGTGVVQTGRDVTANRPSAATAGVGASWYDTTLGQHIESDGTNWTPIAPRSVVTQYTTPQTDTPYTIPIGAKVLRLRVCGPGGPGGSGRRGSAGTVRRGGDSGAGGSYTEWNVAVSDLSVSTLYVTVGAIGTGGAAQTIDDTNGNPGIIGGVSQVKTNTSTTSILNSLAIANPGGPGLGGTVTTGGTAVGGGGRWSGATGIAASATGLVGPGGNGKDSCPPSGGAGGGLTTADVQSAGGTGGYSSGHYASTPAAGTAGGGNGAAGGVSPHLIYGSAGGGGGSTATGGAGGAGGAGGYGAGGGGGGASLNGNNSGAGGNGGGGFVEITAEFS